MPKLILCLLFIFSLSTSKAQIKVYKGTSSFSSVVIFNLNDNKVYKGNSMLSANVVFNISGKKIHKGNSSFSKDVIYTFSGDKVYIRKFDL